MKLLAGAVALTIFAAVPAMAQTPAHTPDPAAAERQAAMARLDRIKGEWVGPASGSNRDGSTYAITQTERIGPMLAGDILVIEGKGYADDGAVVFNAFATVSYDTDRDAYQIHSYAMGRSGTFPMTVTDTGYAWEIPAGPGVMRYTATIDGDSFSEVGEFVMDGRPPMQTFRMDLTRRGDTDWPAAGAVQPR